MRTVTVVDIDKHERAEQKIMTLSRQPMDVVTLWREATRVIASIIPHYWTPCFYTLDPASLLVTSHYHDGLAELPAQWLANEYYGDDVNQITTVATSPTGISTLLEATGGAPQHSPRWHQNMKLGGDQELVARLRTRDGDVWGMLGLYRAPGEPIFDAAEKEFLRRVGPYLADGVRRALLIGEAAEPEHPDSPGLVILDQRWEMQSHTPNAQHWLDELPGGDWAAGRLPSAVLTVAAQALRADRDRESRIALARVLSRSSTWVVLHGAALIENGARRVAIIIEAAHPARIHPLLMAAYKLTDRERDVTRLVLQGASTADIAESLTLSTHTVQQHLKRVFDKTGVRSRRDLVGKVFFAHYEPRLRDNEQRVATDLPVRGGPTTP